jgi:hypothetical protein
VGAKTLPTGKLHLPDLLMAVWQAQNPIKMVVIKFGKICLILLKLQNI